MSDLAFESLCAEVCDAITDVRGTARYVSSARASDISHGNIAMVLAVQGVEIEMRHDRMAPCDLLLTVPFGPLPRENRLQACRALMDVNTLLRWNRSCSFARSPSTGDIVLQCSLPLHLVSGEEVISSVLELADIAHGWREHRFLCPAGESVVASLFASRRAA